jgi:N-terminal acetyltransferase B complex non-catalytic subunit
LHATLSIKQIQHDTLSHIVLSRISTLTTDNEVLQQIAIARTIYASNEDETPPQIYQAFIEETYHNIPDFWDLWMRLRHSLTRNALWRDREIIGWLNNQDMDPVEEISGKGSLDFGGNYSGIV